MLFWYRSRYSTILTTLTNRFKRRHYYSSTNGVVPPADDHVTGFKRTRVLDNTPLSDRSALYGFVRFYAAPVVAIKPKPEPKSEKGPRLNEKISADIIRLVLDDDAHVVVSRHEALDRARKLKLDLVEVDRKSKPPVCKIMDYHREKYKRQVKEKERIKSKAEKSLRKGPAKEVRFTVKTEQKDLQTKADAVKRLMEKGHRVKCMAVGTEDQDLGALVARLSAMIEDVAVIESGPMVEKKQAFIIVRHNKYGLRKGSGKKSSKPSASRPVTLSSEAVQAPVGSGEEAQDAESKSEYEEEGDTQSQSEYEEEGDAVSQSEYEEEEDDAESQSESEEDRQIETATSFGENKTAWSTLDVNEDFENIFGLNDSKSVASSFSTEQFGGETDGVFPPKNVAHTSFPYSQPERPSPSTNSKFPFHAQGHTQVGRRGEVRGRFQPTKPTERTTDNKPLRTNDPSLRPHTDQSPRRGQSPSEVPVPQPSYGVFSAPKNAFSSRQAVPTEVSGNRGSSSNRLNGSGATPNTDAKPTSEGRQRPESGKWGVFGSEIPNAHQHDRSDKQTKFQR